MSFQKGIHYPHPPRGLGRSRYHMSDEARRARLRNLKRARIRSDRETAIIKRLIWQACFESGLRPSQRILSRQLGVSRSYVHKVQKQALSVGMDALLREGRVTPADLEKARQFTAKLRETEPGLLAPVTFNLNYVSEKFLHHAKVLDDHAALIDQATVIAADADNRSRNLDTQELKNKLDEFEAVVCPVLRTARMDEMTRMKLNSACGLH